MKTRLCRLMFLVPLLIALPTLIAACSPETGFLSLEKLARWEAELISKDIQEFQILGSYPTPDGKTMVIYNFILLPQDDQEASNHLGYVIAEADRWGLWHTTSSGDYAGPAMILFDEAIDYQTIYQTGLYSAVFGRVLKPPLTIEANLDNGKVLVDRDGDEGFAFFGTGGGDVVQLSVLDQNEKLVEIIKLDIKQDLAIETLNAFFQNLHEGNYTAAAELYGGSYQVLLDNNPDLDPKDTAALLKNACEVNGFQCLEIYSYGVRDQPSPDEFVVTLQFQDSQGNLFTQGPCCGASETETSPLTEFNFHVVKVASGAYKVMDLPPYLP